MSAQFENVTVVTKANVYFDAKVISHTVRFADGSRKTIGVIHPGEYTFNTDAAERMDIIAGSCRVKQKGASEWTTYNAGQSFHVPAKSAFTIAVASGLAEYICSFE